jgi:hypothetical protein
MSGSLIPNGKQQYLDANGKPLAGGKVYYYIPSTTTPKNTYQDLYLTILNTNPIVLDSAGECIAWGTGAYRQVVTDVNGNLIWDQPTLSFNNDASNVVYTPPFANSVPETVSSKLSQTVSVKDFGAMGDGSTDDTTALINARAFINQNPSIGLTFPSGTYKYSTSPNWAIPNAVIQAVGEVILKYTGIGDCVIFDAGASSQVNNVKFLGNFIIQGGSSSHNGIYLRAVHHSKIEARIQGCGTSYAGLRTEFSVCTEFNVVVSGNELLSPVPTYGYYLTERNAGEKTSDCAFYNPIIESVTSHGIYLVSAIKNMFYGGTSEGNTGYGTYIVDSNSSLNTFIGLDYEANTAGSLYDSGLYNTHINCLYTDLITTGGLNLTFYGGQTGAAWNNTGTVSLTGVNLANAIIGSGKYALSSCRNITTATSLIDVKLNSLSLYGYSVASGVATTVLTLPSTGNNFYQVYAYIPLQGNATAYGAYAVIYQDLTTAKIISQTNGSLFTISLSGQNIQVTQTSGLSQLINIVAQVI